jgi:hypothetical protein
MDKGHENLIRDIKTLLSDAEDYQLHDFQNSRYPAPKMALYNKLNALAANVKEGIYDNEAEAD